MSNCQAGPGCPLRTTDVAPKEHDETPCQLCGEILPSSYIGMHLALHTVKAGPRTIGVVHAFERAQHKLAELPNRERWPETRRALVLWNQEHLDRELAKLPRREWFDRAVAAHLVDEHDGRLGK